MVSDNLISGVPQMVACSAAAVAGVLDFRTYKIPNRLTVPLCLTGFLYHVVGHGLLGLRFSLLGFLVGLGVLALLYIIGAFGAGDVKLLAGVGSWLGPEATFSVFLVAAVGTGVYSLVTLLRHGGLRSVFSAVTVVFLQLQTISRHLAATERVEQLVDRVDRQQRLVPFGLMVAIGVVVVAVGGWRLGMAVLT